MSKYKFSIFITFCLFLNTYSQNNSLLWEISGNNLKAPSYIYGTMHVSSKVAFRLDDVFFEALEKSECIALESDPAQWLKYSYDDLKRVENNINTAWNANFYSKLFTLIPLNKDALRGILRFDNSLINGYLYRKNSFNDDFEEETYIDMFIYQAGKKRGKPIVGLEDINEARFLTTKASYNPYRKKPAPWFTKRMKDENMFSFMEDIYRERNIALLDSIGEATNTEFYREHMLFKRNENMVRVLDTLMHQKTVFSGVGAAHLAGERGMLQLLRDRGYKVRPLLGEQNTYAEQKKDDYEQLFVAPKMTRHHTPDKFISLKSFDSLREFTLQNIKYYIAPEMTNGAYLSVNRLNRFDFLPNTNNKVSLSSIKSLLYEDIPGDIVEQKDLTQPFPGLSILNRTKKGDYQKYHIYKTPLEIIVIKLGGKKDFVLRYEQEIFNSIQFKTKTATLKTFTDPLQKYSFEFPEYFITDNLTNPGQKLIQGISEDDYYFFLESPYHDVKYIEEDAFEAKFIHINFYKDLEVEDYELSETVSDYSSYSSSAKLDSLSNQTLWLKTVVKDASYYVMGYLGSDKASATTYFNSFQVSTPKHERFNTVTDTSLLFTVSTNTKPPLAFGGGYGQRKPYEGFAKSTTYTSKANEKVKVTKYKSHDFRMEVNVDSLWSSIKDFNRAPKYLKEKKQLIRTNEKTYSENGNNIYTFYLKDSASRKRILVKYLQRKGSLFCLETLIDDAEPSAFVSEFYDTFSPIDSMLGKDVFTDKTAAFFEALDKNDSIVLNGYGVLKLNTANNVKILMYISRSSVPKAQERLKEHLTSEFIKINTIEAIAQNVEELYMNSYASPKIQISILNALFEKNTKRANKLALKLMRNDIPLPNDSYDLRFYRSEKDSLDLKINLFPDLLEFTTIKDFRRPVYGLLAHLLDSQLVKPKVYKAHKASMVNNAKIALKRSLNKGYYQNYDQELLLEDYVKLLFPYRKDKSVSSFFKNLLKSDSGTVLAQYYALLFKAKEQIPADLEAMTLHNIKNKAILLDKLESYKLLRPTMVSKINMKNLAESKLLSQLGALNPGDSLNLINTKPIVSDKGENVTLYIFKLKQANSGYDSETLHYVAFEDYKKDTEDFRTKPYLISRKSGKYIDYGTTEEDVIEEIVLSAKHKTRERINKRGYSDY